MLINVGIDTLLVDICQEKRPQKHHERLFKKQKNPTRLKHLKKYGMLIYLVVVVFLPGCSSFSLADIQILGP